MNGDVSFRNDIAIFYCMLQYWHFSHFIKMPGGRLRADYFITCHGEDASAPVARRFIEIQTANLHCERLSVGEDRNARASIDGGRYFFANAFFSERLADGSFNIA